MRRDDGIGVTVTATEKSIIRRAAEIRGESLSGFCRDAALGEARRIAARREPENETKEEQRVEG